MGYQYSHNLQKKILQDDCIFHFAGINRSKLDDEVYKKNEEINLKLFEALNNISFKGKLFFTSSTSAVSKNILIVHYLLYTQNTYLNIFACLKAHEHQ